MSFSIPKSVAPHNSLLTPSVLPVDLNDVDVDRMLTRILEMGVKLGRTATSKVDTTDYETYLDSLRASPHLVGFGGERGREVLDGWVRSSILVMERKGRSKTVSQMGFLRPLTIAGYRSGLPKPNRSRRADALAYQSMVRYLAQRDSDSPSRELEKLFKATFGRGVDIGESPWHNPRYDEKAELDIDTLLALRFLEGFEGSQNLTRESTDFDPPVLAAVDPLGRDLVTFLELYGPKLTVSEAYAHISAVLAIRLFALPLVTATYISQLRAAPQRDITPTLEIYCDFVRKRGSASDDVSQRSVLRDLEVMRTFLGDRLLLRTLGEARKLLPGPSPAVTNAEAELRATAEGEDDTTLQMALNMIIQQIYRGLEDGSEGRAYIDEVRAAPGLSVADQVQQILVEGLRKNGVANQVQWFHSTGGISKTYGFLSGTLRGRSTWRYAPSDETLTTLLMLCFINNDGTRTSKTMPIQELLARLEKRFGVLIDRPPSVFDSADARAGAAENRLAFAQRLKLLGCFQSLSDDFSAQFVTRPREATR